MSTNNSQRIYDFLKAYPPFDILEKNQLKLITSKIRTLHLKPNQLVFSQKETPHEYFYVVVQGAIELRAKMEESSILLDICDEGDVFGLRPLIQKDNYLMSANAKEESIIYGIPIATFKDIIKENNKVYNFIIASFTTNIKDLYSKNEPSELFANEDIIKKSNLFFDSQLATYSTNPITCKKGASIKESAQSMSEHQVGSIVIEKNNKPIGIITNKDLRSKIATGLVSIEENVTQIMSSPVITVSDDITVAEAQIIMLKYNISHLCITTKGDTNSDLKGILSERDILILRGNNPSAFIKNIKRAKDIEALTLIREKTSTLLAQYLEQKTPIIFISKIISEINKSITNKIIEFSLNEMPYTPPVKFAWLSLGSQGRNEQLLLTDQDNALVFEDVNEELHKTIKAYFLELAKKVTEKLNKVGFEYCPADMMASNPKWCLSLSEWKSQFNHWIQKPSEKSIMMCTIFFDFNCLNGEEDLAKEISKSIIKSINSFDIFLNYLGRNAILNPPPIGFFRQLIVESNGAHKNEFDLKARALMPLIDAARLLILSHQIENKVNTISRYQTLAELEPQNKDLYESCIDSFKILQRHRSEQGLLNNDSGRYLRLQTLSKSEKLRLKGCFKPIKDVQGLLTTRYKLSQIM
ncbi:DUF294 nucleotidyltransferase-like domain-containing protein [Algibacter sp. L4_22]|uniref:DUF294 nucleotidyltransferase-like domain-containing protein n=1 Tax=Algibacter sp. L4_22 TaxID=2942477 RepID=UPI00201B6DA6|nr:DUF294 nucleotidyltransferase-like domain-containing protein [Algibacter sp. L4_22]